MNLIKDDWIPTDVGVLSPAKVLQQASSIRWQRPDWDRATEVMLIGMLQTAILDDPSRCPDEKQWREYLDHPVDVTAWLTQLSQYFGGNVFEDHEPLSNGKVKSVSMLYPDAPGENAIKKSSDITSWFGVLPSTLSPTQSKIALYSDATWGVAWGAGHKQGPRGGSAMTVLVEPVSTGNLWQKIWLNVLPENRWHAYYQQHSWNPNQIFPWIASLRTEVTPGDTHSSAIYWAMPRRIRLINSGAMRILPRGTDWKGWTHPLTPYLQNQEGGWSRRRIGTNHVGYRDWAAIATITDNKVRIPVVVNEFIERHWNGEQLRLRTCGWAQGGSNETASWVEQVIPLIVDADPVLVNDMLDVVTSAKKKLHSKLSEVLPKGVRIESDRLFANTEQEFYQRVRSGEEDGWQRTVRRAAFQLYDEITRKYAVDPFKEAQQRARL